eukprot:scaffold2511_cov153-Skeletonema_menzelii.AAC.2
MGHKAISGQYHRSRSCEHVHHSRRQHSRSLDPRPRDNYSYNNSSQHNYSDSRKRPRSPDRRHQNTEIFNSYDRSSRIMSFGDGRPKDATSYERHPLASTSGAEKHRAPPNALHLHENAENYANASYGNDMSNMSNYRSHYYQPQSRYEHPIKGTSYERRRLPLASRQEFSSNPRSLQHKSAPLLKPRFNNNQTIPELIQITHANLAALTPGATAAFWNKVSKQITSGRNAPDSRLSNHHKELGSHLNQIFEHTQNTLSLFNAKDLSQTIYSMAKPVDVLRKNYGRRHGCGEDIIGTMSSRLLNRDLTPKKELFRSFAFASRDKIDQLDARGLSNIAYAYALLGNVPDFDDGSDLFDLIATQAARRRAEFNAQGISNIAWAYATVGKSHPLLFEAMGDQVVALKHLGEFIPQELSILVWAYATAGVRHSKLFEKMANHVVRLDVMYGFKPQHLSNTVWAYATVCINHPKLFEAVANHIVKSDSLDRFDPQALSNTAWAYATTGFNHPKLFETVANHIVESDNLDRFYPQALSNAVWAYATAGINHRKLFEKVANHIVESSSLDRFNPQNLANTVWAYATAQVSHPKLFQKVSKYAIHRKEEFDSQAVANLLWSYATMGITDKHLFLSFVPTAANLVDCYNNQELANIAWAYAVVGVDAPSLFNETFIKKCVEKKGVFKRENLCQLYQWHLRQSKKKSKAGLPLEILDRSHEAFISVDPTVSKLQDDVVAQLSSIGLDPKEEVLMDSGYRLDAIVKVNGKTVGIEVDGPSHFIGKSRSPTGSTILKRRQVPSIDDIELVSVPYWEWDKLDKDEVKEQEYLRNLLGL